jgi:hypothetical protein
VVLTAALIEAGLIAAPIVRRRRVAGRRRAGEDLRRTGIYFFLVCYLMLVKDKIKNDNYNCPGLPPPGCPEFWLFGLKAAPCDPPEVVG